MIKNLFVLILLFAFTSINAQVNLNSGLVAYFPFSGNANDISGNNINGSVTGASLTTDRFNTNGNAYYFDGNSYIGLPYSNLYNFSPQGEFSISVWVLPDQGYSWPAQAVVVKSPPNPNFLASNWNYGTYILNYHAMAGFAGVNFLNGTTTFTSTQCWYNIIQTYKNGIWNLYVNGNLEASDASQTKFILQDGPASKIFLGKKGESNGDYYKGKMDDVRIYNRVLTTDEIASIYNENNATCQTNNCNNWLSTPLQPSYVTVGDLDVPGNQITVEAVFNRTTPYTGGILYAGDLVSKHKDPTDANYLLRPNTAEITTTNGYYRTPDICEIELNKTYHVAMVYDGSTLKFYRNGFLMSQVTATGNLFQNNWQTNIGFYQSQLFPTNFIGFINEVRIWNVARSQTQIQTYMNSSLPSPGTQTGLLAYYIFNDLFNKQGNPTWNGTLADNATINATNPNCAFVADSCDKIIDTVIINNYTPVLALDPCKNILTVEDASKFNVGDTVLMIQMKGAVIDSSNTAAFGNVTNYKSAGNYEFNYIKSKTGNNIELLNTITRTYEIPAGKVQLIRVPYYGDVTFNSVLTCLPWDGSKGGILVFNSSGTVTLNEDIDVSGRGFNGGNYEQMPSACDATDYFYPSSSTSAALKGEGIVQLGNNMTRGRGKAANGGGSGNDHNSGGAGGSNYGAGGNGGKEFGSGFCAGIANGGIGGSSLTYSNLSNKIFPGGGGGAGDINGVLGGFKGGNGGGIVIINSNSINGNSNSINSVGEDAADCTTNDCWESGSGGGSGGTVLINTNSFSTNINVNTSGGRGGSLSNTNAAGYSAPGGGGGGGMLWLNSASIPVTINYTTNGGNNGLFTALNETGGATSGQAGSSLTNLKMPFTTIPFKPNIDSVRIKDNIFNCSSFDFKGLGYVNTNPINSWQWNFGNGATASTQNTNYSYNSDGTFPVKLTITDINGCKDSTTKNVIVQSLIVDAGKDTTICKNSAYQLSSSVLNAISFNWTPSQYVNNSSIQNPIATVSDTQKLYVTATNNIGCIATDSVTISVYPNPQFGISPDQSVCKNETIQLTASGGNTYQWLNDGSLSATNIPNPSASPDVTTTYAVKITDQCNISDSLFTTVTVNDLPIIALSKSNDIDCSNDKATLTATGAAEYIWSPVTGLDNPNSPKPIASPATTTEYTVKATDDNGCIAEGKITVEVSTNNKSGYNIPNAFTPNGDGRNDCVHVKYWGPTTEFEFNIYNRWGEKVFTSKNTDSCWDGTYKGVQQPLGVYVYYIKAKTACGDVFKKGTITLIR
ncbi:MAG: gliding motility-associated C-terminal domain-containing protein [Sphingobacteriales bacterium]|nr:gliding motility-associated C-terminal domain-containing protein [Sphingobacteriales bacterium]